MLVRRLKEAAKNVDLREVFDTLMDLIVERSKVCFNVLIGGASAAQLWRNLARVSLEGGVDKDNAPHLLRDIFVSLGNWLTESCDYAEVAESRNKCTRLIRVNMLPYSRPCPTYHLSCLSSAHFFRKRISLMSLHLHIFSGNSLGVGLQRNRIRRPSFTAAK